MSKRQVSLTISINGKEVANTLRGVGAEVGRLRSDLSKINESDPNFATKSAELKKARERYAELSREINGLPKFMKAADDSFTSQKYKVEQLKKELDGMSRSSSGYKNKIQEYRSEMKRLDDLNTEMTGKPTFWDKIAGQASMFTTIATGIFTFQKMAQGMRQLIDLSAELADKQADVRKTTGMSKDEVRELTHELDKLNTRTSRLDLLSIATEGGRIGIPKEDIAEFTEAMDKANVALGDVFGSAEEVASTLGKLRFLYKETAEMGVAEAYNKIGSSLNELGANGVASEQNIAAFATRVGALPNAFKPSIADAMALGAAFEESGVNAEVAGRSYGILVQTAANNTAAFAKQMKMTKTEVEELINRDPVEFFLKFTNSFKGMDRNGVQMAKTLKDLGISADGVNKIIGAAANNNDRFRESLALSNEAMDEATSLTNEFNVKNENLAATVEKIQKTFIEWIDSDTVQDFVEDLVNWFGRLIGAVDGTDKKTSTFIKTLDFTVKALSVLIASFVSYSAAMKLSALWSSINVKNAQLFTLTTKGATMAQVLQTIAVSAGGVAYHKLTGNTYAAARAQVALNSAMRANPWGLALGALTALVGAIYYFTKSTNEAAEAQKNFGEKLKTAQEKAVESISKTINKVNSLVNVIKDEKISLDTRKKAYEELVKINSIFNGLLDDEKFNIEKLNVVYRIYIDQLKEMARTKSLNELTNETSKDVIDSEFKLYQKEKELANARAKLNQTKRTQGKIINVDGVIEEIEVETQAYKNQAKVVNELKEAVKEASIVLKKNIEIETEANNMKKDTILKIDQEIDQARKNIEAYSKYSDTISKTIVKNNERKLKDLEARRNLLIGGSEQDLETHIPSTSPSNKPSKKEDPEPERRRRIAEELLKIEIAKNRKIRDEKLRNREEEIELMEDGFDKEWAKLGVEHEKRLNKLSDEKEDLLSLQKEYERRAEEERAKGNKAGQDGFKKQADEIKSIVKIKDDELLLVDQTFMLKYQTLKHEFDKKSVEDKQKTYERELRNLETFHLNQLQSITDLESAKEVLKNEYGFDDAQLDKLKNLEDAKKAITLEQGKITAEKQKEMFQSQIDEFERLINEELANRVNFGEALMSDKDLDNLVEKLEIAKNALAKVMTPEEEAAAEENKKLMGFIDILGFSGDQWEEAFSNLDTMSGKLALVQMGVQALSNAWGQYHALQQKNMQRDLDAFTASTNRKKDELKKQLDEGYISEATYNAKVAKMDADLEKKRAEMEYASAMSEWKMSLLQAATNTAVGITAALAQGKWYLTAIVASMGALQAGMIAANKPSKPKGYFEGGRTRSSGNYDAYGRELADGPVHANEYVIPEWLRQDPQIARMEDFIEARRTGMRPESKNNSDGYADGGVTRPLDPVAANPIHSATNPVDLTSTLNRLNDYLENLQENPIEARLTRSLEVAKVIFDDIEDYKNHRNKNKR